MLLHDETHALGEQEPDKAGPYLLLPSPSHCRDIAPWTRERVVAIYGLSTKPFQPPPWRLLIDGVTDEFLGRTAFHPGRRYGRQAGKLLRSGPTLEFPSRNYRDDSRSTDAVFPQ